MTRIIFYLTINTLVTACLLVTAGCGRSEPQNESVPEIRPGILAGYLPRDAYPDSVKLSPPPPARGSAALAMDEEISRENLALNGTDRWNLALQDARLAFPEAAGIFSCALRIDVTEQNSPNLYRLLRRSLVDAAFSTSAGKAHYRRTRPFAVNKQPACRTGAARRMKTDDSYPSGHAAIGWAWALILSELVPERGDAILARGRTFGQSRVVCNLHWQSDVTEARVIAAATVARLHADPVFRYDLNASRAEVVAGRTEEFRSARDCDAEAAILAQ